MPLAGKITRALAKQGQAPHTAIVGCADSRAALEAIFDAMPGDLFVLRNVGNSFTHAEGSVMGSLEFCTGTLQTQLILILGHTGCAAVRGATRAFLNSSENKVSKAGKALDSLLAGLSSVARGAALELGEDATEAEIANLAVQMNVFHTMDFLLTNSAFISDKVQKGEVDIQGGIYNLESGRVTFLGRSPNQSKIVNTF
ncbi:mtcA2 [Symbiodinium natans]|uniref:Carbonic anhydrase n=1 Tax=Symbiodinium natans TaxID=878477 RepID=A0A812L081_9DINO|nr:mtcA2 [Symbiodinium natans]